MHSKPYNVDLVALQYEFEWYKDRLSHAIYADEIDWYTYCMQSTKETIDIVKENAKRDMISIDYRLKRQSF